MWFPAKLIIARILANVFAKPIIHMQAIETISNARGLVTHWVKDMVYFMHQHWSMLAIQYPDAAKILK